MSGENSMSDNSGGSDGNGHARACLLSAERLAALTREHVERPLPRRFYEAVSVARAENGQHTVLLDGRALRTPLKKPLHLPTRALAEAIAAEWRAQEERINPAAMPLTGLANAAIDKAADEQERAALTKHIGELAAHDLLCYRADEATQPELAVRQRAQWDPLLDWAAQALGARLHCAQGIMPVTQPQEAIDALLPRYRQADAFAFIALFAMATLSRSAVLPLALLHGRIDAEQGWRAATLEEQWNMEQWGTDEQAQRQLEEKEQAFLAAARFLRLLEKEG